MNLFVYEYDRTRQALLEERGYKNLGHDGYMRRRSLDKAIPQAVLPEGYSIRNINAKDQGDLEKRAALANNAFGIDKHTAQTVQTLQKALTYRSDRDLVVVAPDGAFAAYCVVWYDEANRIGMLGPVGTHPAYSRRGLGKAVVSEGLRLLEELEATTAYVDSSLDVTANRLYEWAGFSDFYRFYHWQKAF